MSVKAGNSEVQKVLRKFPGLVLVGAGRHKHLELNGEPLRLPDGRKLQVACSPSNPSQSAQRLLRDLQKLGVA